MLELGPDELAGALLQRRLMLKDSLPGVIRNLEAEEESIVPKLERLERSFEGANKKVAELKMKRDESQSRASALIPDVKSSRVKLLEEGGMKSLDPKWKKKRVMEVATERERMWGRGGREERREILVRQEERGEEREGGGAKRGGERERGAAEREREKEREGGERERERERKRPPEERRREKEGT